MSSGLRFSLAVAFVSFSAASADGPQRITASVGETVILPCSTPLSNDAPAVEWSKKGISPEVIFLYRDGCETFEMKNKDFRYRTNLIMNELKNGNISLRISNLKLSDSGTYQCMTLLEKRVVETLELVVGAVSEPNPNPNLQFVPSDGDTVTVQCEAACGSPEPEIVFLDDQEIEIVAEKPQRDLDGGRCRTIKRTATLQKAISRVTCKVHQWQNSQTRETEIFIPDGCFRSSCTVRIAVTILCTLGICGVAFAVYLLCKKHVSTECSRPASKSPDLHTSTAGPQSGQSPSQGLACRKQADSVGNAELQREMEKLKSTLSERENRINYLTATVNELLSKPNPVLLRSQSLNESKSSASSAASSTSNLPKHDNLPKTEESTPAVSRQNQTPGRIIRKDDNESAPDLQIIAGAGASSSSPSAAAKGTDFVRSKSLSQLRLSTNLTMPLRRNSLSNRFSVLENLSEEAEQLIQSSAD